MIARLLLTFVSLCAVSVAAVRSGKAEADWISESATYESGKPVRTALRLVLDPGWHTYWENPGEGGMKISAKMGTARRVDGRRARTSGAGPLQGGRAGGFRLQRHGGVAREIHSAGRIHPRGETEGENFVARLQ